MTEKSKRNRRESLRKIRTLQTLAADRPPKRGSRKRNRQLLVDLWKKTIAERGEAYP